MSELKQSPSSVAEASRPITPWSPAWRVVVSLLLVLHLAAVFAAPWSAPPPSSGLSQAVARRFLPYLQVAYLNHGYRFFAPNPGPSHLVRYELEMPDGSVRTGRFPDLRQHWPRLLYHRHLMISETVFNLTEPFVEPPPMGALENEQQRQQYEQEKANASRLVSSIAGELIRRHGARRARLFLQVHVIPPPWDLQRGMLLDDERLYEERELGDFDGEDL